MVLEALKAAIVRRGLQHEVTVTARGCFGLCRLAPNLYIEPDGIWYSRFTVEDVEEIVEEHLMHGRVVRRLVHYEPAAPKPEGTSHDAGCGSPRN